MISEYMESEALKTNRQAVIARVVDSNGDVKIIF